MAKRLTRMALLAALALIIFTLEAQLPPPVPIPGVKLGLANIITVYALFRLGPRDSLLILLTRILLGNLFAGSVTALFFSLGGGLLCWVCMVLLRPLLTGGQLWVASVLGAMAHNLGQMLVTVAVYRTAQLFIYLPVLLLSGLVTGLFTGLCAQFLLQRLENRK